VRALDSACLAVLQVENSQLMAYPPHVSAISQNEPASEKNQERYRWSSITANSRTPPRGKSLLLWNRPLTTNTPAQLASKLCAYENRNRTNYTATTR